MLLSEHMNHIPVLYNIFFRSTQRMRYVLNVYLCTSVSNVALQFQAPVRIFT